MTNEFDPQACIALKDQWVNWDGADSSKFNASDYQNLNSGQKIEFLSILLTEKPLSVDKLKAMESLYKLNSVVNSEIRFRWIRLGLLAKWEDAVPRAVQMVTEQGRMKFLRPIYR